MAEYDNRRHCYVPPVTGKFRVYGAKVTVDPQSYNPVTDSVIVVDPTGFDIRVPVSHLERLV